DVGGEEHRDGRLVDPDEREGLRALWIGDGLADFDRLDSGDRDEVAGAGLRDLDSLQSLVPVEHRDLGELGGAVPVDDGDAVGLADAPVDDAADDEPAHVIVPVEHRDAELEAHRGVEARWRDGGEDRLEERDQRAAGLREVGRRRAGPRVRVEDGELELVLGRVEVDEEVVHLVEDLGRPRVAAVDLVDDDDGREPGLEGLLQHEPGLGSGPSAASTRRSTPSTSVSVRSTSEPKSAWPGVSTMLMWTPRYAMAVFLAMIVMPFSRSRSIESMMRSGTDSFWRKRPDCQSMASTRVVLPWSTWAMIAMLRIESRCCIFSSYHATVGARLGGERR